VQASQSVDEAAAEVLADEVHRPDGHVRDECVQVFGGDRTRVALVGDGVVPEDAKVDGVRSLIFGAAMRFPVR